MRYEKMAEELAAKMPDCEKCRMRWRDYVILTLAEIFIMDPRQRNKELEARRLINHSLPQRLNDWIHTCFSILAQCRPWTYTNLLLDSKMTAYLSTASSQGKAVGEEEIFCMLLVKTALPSIFNQDKNVFSTEILDMGNTICQTVASVILSGQSLEENLRQPAEPPEKGKGHAPA